MKLNVAPPKLGGDDFIQPLRAVDSKWCGPFSQIEAGQNPHQSQVMIPMKVGNKNFVDFGGFDFKPPHLYLCRFSTIQ